MLKKFEVRNYRTFHGSISIDFTDVTRYKSNTDCLYDGVLAKMLVYGRNATGKTNLGRALSNIKSQLGSGNRENPSSLLNADSLDDDIYFTYTFSFDYDEIKYEYALNSMGELIKESYILNNALIYSINFESGDLNFSHLSELKEGDILYKRYLDNTSLNVEDSVRMPFLRWLLANVPLSNATHLLSLQDYVDRMKMVQGTTMRNTRKRGIEVEIFYRGLAENTRNLRSFEKFINDMGVKCRLTMKKLPEGTYELYFVHEKLVPFWSTASSGTMALMDLYRDVFSWNEKPSVLYMDEFDAFYHYEMAEKMVEYLKHEYPESQVIWTSHNTNLMTNRLMRPDCVLLLSQNGRLTSLPHATSREIREAHNLEKMYIGGEFRDYE